MIYDSTKKKKFVSKIAAPAMAKANLQKKFIEAAFDGDMDTVERLIGSVDVNCTATYDDYSGVPAIRGAVLMHNVEMAEFLISHGANSRDEMYVALFGESTKWIDTLLSTQSFSLTHLMPLEAYAHSEEEIYKKTRKYAIRIVMERMDENNLSYSKKVAVDVNTILKSEPKPSDDDIKALEPLIKKLASMDWMSDAQVSSADFGIE